MPVSMTNDPTLLQIDDLVLDTNRRLVFRGGDKLALSDRAFDALLALVRAHPEPLLTKPMDIPGAQSAVNDARLVQHVRQLRHALGDKSDTPRYIEAVGRNGYRLMPDPRPCGSGHRRRYGRRRQWLAGVGAAVAAGLFVGAFVLRPTSPSPPVFDPSPAVAKEYVDQAYHRLSIDSHDDNQAARELFRRALEIKPNYCPALSGLSLALSQGVSRFHSDTSEAVEAERLAREVLARDDEGYRGYLALAASFDAQGLVDQAIAAYQKALQRQPGDTGIAISLAYLMMHRGRLADSLELSVEGMSMSDSAPFVELQVAQVLAILGHSEKAEQLLLRAHTLQPENVSTAEALAWFYFKTRRHDDAARVVASAMQAGAVRAELHHVLGLTAMVRGDLIAAAAIFRRGLSVDPGHEEVATSLLLAELANGVVDEQQVRQHCERIQQAIVAGNAWSGSHLMLVSAYAQVGELDLAVANLSDLIEGGFVDAAMLRSLPWMQPLHGHDLFESRIAAIQNRVDDQRQAAMRSRYWSAIGTGVQDD